MQLVSVNIMQHEFSIANVANTKYQVPGSMCPRVRLPGHVVASGRLVRRSPIIDGGDDRSIDVSMLASRYGGQCLRRLGSRLCLISNAAVLWCCCPLAVYGTDWTGSVSAGSEWKVFSSALGWRRSAVSRHMTFSRGHNPTCHIGEFSDNKSF